MLCSIYQQANIFIVNWRCRWRSGNDFAKQEVMSLRTQAPRKSKGFSWIQNGVCWSCNLAPTYRKVFLGIKYNDYQSTATTKRLSYPVRFFRVLCSQNGRIWKNFKCSNYENPRIIRARNVLNQQLTPVTWHFERATGSLPGNCRRILEGYWFVLQRSYKIPFLHAKYSNKTT